MVEMESEEPSSWSQAEVDHLHRMVKEDMLMRLLQKKAMRWAVWGLGLPGAVLMVWEPIARLWKLLKGL